jgi:hypothetical protein
MGLANYRRTGTPYFVGAATIELQCSTVFRNNKKTKIASLLPLLFVIFR